MPEPIARIPSKLAIHGQNQRDWMRQVVSDAGMRYIVLLAYNNDPFTGYGKTKIIARPFIGGDHVEQAYVDRGRDGAREYFELLRSRYNALRDSVWGWTGPNECRVATRQDRVNLSEFTYTWTRLMFGARLRPLIDQTSTGAINCTDDQALRELGLMFASSPWSVAHYYSKPGSADLRVEARWYGLRCLELVPRLRALGLNTPVIHISEFGIYEGWRKSLNWEQYHEQLLWADEQFARIPQVRSVHLYNSGGVHPWESFEVDEAQWRSLIPAG